MAQHIKSLVDYPPVQGSKTFDVNQGNDVVLPGHARVEVPGGEELAPTKELIDEEVGLETAAAPLPPEQDSAAVAAIDTAAVVVADSLLHNPQLEQTSFKDLEGQDSRSWGGENLYDVYSLSDLRALDGTYYKDW